MSPTAVTNIRIDHVSSINMYVFQCCNPCAISFAKNHNAEANVRIKMGLKSVSSMFIQRHKALDNSVSSTNVTAENPALTTSTALRYSSFFSHADSIEASRT